MGCSFSGRTLGLYRYRQHTILWGNHGGPVRQVRTTGPLSKIEMNVNQFVYELLWTDDTVSCNRGGGEDEFEGVLDAIVKTGRTLDALKQWRVIVPSQPLTMVQRRPWSRFAQYNIT